MHKCGEVMTKNPVCCVERDLVETAAQLMQTEDIGAVPVVDGLDTKKLIGIVTDRDLALRVISAGREVPNTRVGDVMTPLPVTCYPDDDLDMAAAMMADHQVRRIPVVDSDRHLMGIISQADLATRMSDSGKVGEVVGEISQPNNITIRK